MAIDHRPGALYWIDHFAVPTNDIDRWVDWNGKVLGATEPWADLVFEPGAAHFADFRWLCGSHVIGFAQQEPLPDPNKPLGQSYPRWGFYIRAEEVEDQLRRLDRLGVPHTDAIRTSEEGEEGIAIYFEDGDKNQYEFWAPQRLPDGAMENCGPQRVGRMSHGVLESRDLDRTAAFYSRFCGLDPLASADIPADTLVLPLEAGGRLVFKKVDQLTGRTGASRNWRGVHHAFIVRDEEYIPSYQRMWAELPEWERRPDGSFDGNPADLPARTGLHGSAAGRRFKERMGRGDQIIDWDTNAFHLVGGTSDTSPTLATYQGKYMEDYVEILTRDREGGAAS